MPKIPLEHGTPDKYGFPEWMGQYPRESVRWLPPEEQELEAAYRRGVSVPELARRHGRREGGITSRLSRLLGQAFIEEYIFNNKQPQAKENKMVKNDLYIQYLEDAMNHAKTGEPMKCWQIKIRNQHDWLNLSEYALLPESIHEEVQLRIKPEPFKWTTYAFTTNGTKNFIWTDTVRKHHVSAEDLQRRFPKLSIIAVHHHEVNVDD